MRDFWGPVATIVWKDLLLEFRTKDIVVSVLVFALLVVVIFNFALDPTPGVIALVAPGVLWVSITFAGVLGLTRSLALEKDSGNLHALMVAPIGREAIFYGKMFANLVFMLAVEAVVFPVFAILFNLPIASVGLVPVAILATLGIAAVGTVFAAMAVNTRSREAMLPLLFFPVMVPVVVAAVEASGIVLRGETGGDLVQWLALLGAFDAIFIVACPAAFNMVVEE
ncbi:MAG: heme exporter protein CcmB [Chloroflexi bacterium]|nr:heme exporter protein CcmB [Chloroflexota bacterium]